MLNRSLLTLIKMLYSLLYAMSFKRGTWTYRSLPTCCPRKNLQLTHWSGGWRQWQESPQAKTNKPTKTQEYATPARPEHCWRGDACSSCPWKARRQASSLSSTRRCKCLPWGESKGLQILSGSRPFPAATTSSLKGRIKGKNLHLLLH